MLLLYYNICYNKSMKTNTLVHPAHISYAYDIYDILIKEVKAPLSIRYCL